MAVWRPHRLLVPQLLGHGALWLVVRSRPGCAGSGNCEKYSFVVSGCLLVGRTVLRKARLYGATSQNLVFGVVTILTELFKEEQKVVVALGRALRGSVRVAWGRVRPRWRVFTGPQVDQHS